jgi:hypothetical protein
MGKEGGALLVGHHREVIIWVLAGQLGERVVKGLVDLITVSTRSFQPSIAEKSLAGSPLGCCLVDHWVKS